ncbi:hypothetical protein, conserved [Babesia ovata]|uniref:Uncharacterized protein n=1 Tax=Babesia ovata TaxID=189622 RepID=A0A2H6KJQ7_9APIC|nr:uncharacterized protein BOVATA_047190 [Babesia ovata]GBE63226.1 hypothetical protein, conserved [Babesia ovata]
MAFLHGVLGNIKDKLGQHKGTLDTALKSLKSTNNNGITKYKAAVAEVAGGVRAYNVSVERSNDAVKSVINKLQKQIGSEFLSTIKNILPKKEAPKNIFPPPPVEPYTSKEIREAETLVNKKLEDCKQNAAAFCSHLETEHSAHKNSINDLNDNLRVTLSHVRSTVAYEAKRLGEVKAAKAAEFSDTEEKITATLKSMKISVDCKIDAQIKELISKLREKVQKILDELRGIDKRFREYYNALQEWIIKAEKVVDEAHGEVNRLLGHINNTSTTYPMQITSRADQLERDVEGFYNAGQAATEKVIAEVAKALAAVEALEDFLKWDLHGVREQLGQQIREYLREYVTAVKKEVGSIEGDGKAPTAGLFGIINGVREYVNGYKENFEKTVGDWVTQIMDKKPVNFNITSYIRGDRTNFNPAYKNGGNVESKIKSAISNQIAKQLLNGFSEQPSFAADNIQTSLESIKTFLSTFAGSIGISKSETIVAAIEGEIKISGVSSYEKNLTEALRYIIPAIFSTANQAGEQIGKLMKTCKLEYINKAFAAAEGLSQKLDGALGRGTDPVPGSVYDVNTKINNVLDKQLPIDREAESRGQSYVKVDHLTNSFKKIIAGDDNTKKTALKGAITQIQDDVTGALGGIETLKDGALADLRNVKEYIKRLCEAIKKDAGDDKGDVDDTLRGRLNDLKKRYFEEYEEKKRNGEKSVKKIQKQFGVLHMDLVSKPIKDAEAFITFCSDAEKHFTKLLKEEIERDVQNAKDDLIVHARKQYVDTIKASLERFAVKVTEELQPLPQELRDDLEQGHKGFMDKLGRYFLLQIRDFFPTRIVPPEQRKTLKDFADIIRLRFNDFVVALCDQADFKKNVSVFLEPSRQALHRLLTDLIRSEHFDRTFNTNIDNFNNVLHNFAPKQFAGPCSPLLDALNAGLNRLGTELNKAYVNTYDGVTFDQLLSDKVDPQTKAPGKELTDEGRNCAKVCLTILDTFYHQLYYLFYHCYAKWSTQTIEGKKDYEELRKFLERQGYDVVQLNKDKSGREVGAFLTTAFASHKEFEKSQLTKKTLTAYLDTFRDPTGPVSQLFHYLNTYYDVCQLPIPPSKKHPSSIYDMLTWLSGLTHNRVHHELALNGFAGLFEKPKDKASEVQADDPILLQQDDDALEAYPKRITAMGLSGTLAEVCHYSYETLVAILGNGHSGGVYACEFNINAQGFVYPSNMNTLICMLYEILQRVYEQCYFLYQMCTHDTTLSGWKECWYGNGVGGSSWKCNNLQCANQTGDQTHNQCGNQRANQTADQLGDQPCNQTGDQRPNCGLKSPLQSFLEDGLQGFLPHSLDGTSGKLNCAVKNHFNVPCKTPMGFADITTVASHKQNGHYLRDMLHEFCGNKSSLTSLLSQLRCVLPSAPKTLGDMFGFYNSLLADWDGKGSNHVQRNQHREAAYRDAVQNANFGNPDTDLELTSMFSSSSHGFSKDTSHLIGDLYSLLKCTYKRTNDPAHPCGPYVKPLCRDTCGTFADKHAGKHLSTVVYLTESFYDLLKQLYETCNSKCGKKETKCYAKSCANSCVKKQSKSKPNGIIHDAACSSIVSCKTTLPTLYSNGFVFGDAAALNTIGTKRTCADFCRALENIVKEGKSLYMIVYKHIPEFLFKIREPFIWTLLALWSLSLLYLLHITVVRLDVLRIRSHLRSPSSHRIAAQSLLAAARVKALASSLNEQIDLLKNSDNSQNESKIADLKSQLKDHIAKYHSLSESDRTAQLKDVHSRLLSLADLSGKLGQFVGPEKAVTKAINDGINIIIDSDDDFKSLRKSQSSTAHPPAPVSAGLINDAELTQQIRHYEDLKKRLKPTENSQNHSLSSEESRLLSSCQSKLDALEKLKSLNESFKSLKNPQSDNCKNLLNNLCSGLEKFLGYQETSKGYDGSGIVYSDLDRLCDGVMSFLHGVFDAVKDDDNVTKYDNDTLNNVIDKLNDSVGKGRQAFPEAVAQVSEWLKKHGAQVDQKIKNVTDPLNKLLNGDPENNFKKIPSLIADIQGMQGEPYDEVSGTGGKLHKWLSSVSGLTEKTEESLKALDSVDKQLSNKLHPHVNLLHNAVDTFVANSRMDHQDLIAVCTKVDGDLEALETNVNAVVTSSVGQLKTTVTAGINELDRQVKKILDEKVKTLQETVKKLETIRGKIETAVGSINERFKENGSKNGDETVPCCQKKAQKINEDATEIKTYDLTKLWRDIATELMKLTDGIAKRDGVALKDGSLDQIVAAVRTYATDFKGVFERKISEMVTKVLAAKPVSSYVTSYVTTVNGRNRVVPQTMTAENVRKVADTLSTNITEDLKMLAKSTQSTLTPKGKIDEDLQAVQDYLKIFAGQVAGKLQSAVDQLVPKIEQGLRKKNVMANPHGELYLKRSVQCILTAVSTAAGEAGKELTEFSTLGQIGRLATAISAIKKLCENLRDKVVSVQMITKIQDSLKCKVIEPADDIRNKLTQIIAAVNGEIEKLQKIVKNKFVHSMQPEENLKRLDEAIERKVDGLDSGIKRVLGEQVATLRDNVLNPTTANCQEDIKSSVSTETKRSKTQIKNEALQKFAKTKEKELNELKKIVATQKAEIEKILKNDRANGLKGFLLKLKGVSGKDLESLKISDAMSSTGDKMRMQFAKLSDDFRNYLYPMLEYIGEQVKTPGLPGELGPYGQDQENEYSKKVYDIHGDVRKLLRHLNKNESRKHNFDHEFLRLHDSLTSSLNSFTSSKFDGIFNATLCDVLRASLSAFGRQLGNAYVNRYSTASAITDWDTVDGDGRKAAKILVTIMRILDEALSLLKYECERSWKQQKICLVSKPNIHNPLGAFFKDCGYRVSRTESSYEGELRCHENMRGGHVFNKLLDKAIPGAAKDLHLPKCKPDEAKTQIKSTSQFNIFHILDCLTSHVGEYYQSCHLGLPKSKKYPCSVRDICVWLSGLPHTAVYKTIDGHCQKILNQKDEATNTFPNKEDTVMQRSLQHLNGNIKHICKLAPKILVSIQGHGSGASHAAYPYACCFENNHGQFYYPGDPSSLLDILKDMCMRLLRAFSFLYQQCKHTASDGNGWRECQYGYRVGTYQWDCNEPSDNSSTQPKSQAKCQPNSEANDQPNCLPRSPLQAHLMDGLPGFMPHKFTAVGCQPTCSTCPKGSLVGQCITPMGFADLATAGSIVGRGDDLVDVLATLCKNGGSVLCELVHALQCISPSPPKGLAEMFSYYCNIFQKSYGSLYGHEDTYQTKINDTINKSFPLWPELHGKYDASKLTGALRKLYYSKDGHHQPHIKNGITPGHKDLYSLVAQDSCALTEIANCAPYLKALCHDACHTYPAKHKALYLSWLCRLAWTFWDLLDQLLKAFSDISCQSYGCLSKCGFGKHGVTEEDTSQAPKASKPSCHCNSIVQCKGPMSVFYQYGFTFGLPKELMGSESKKTCDNFVKQLTRVLTKGYFKELFDEIDEFIWAIRTPFSYLLLSLWSLSLLYLLHIAVVRLDVLRIRSHLRSPSSHRIAAQSLLAAARVRALANVKNGALDDIDARRISLGQLAGQLSGLIGGSEEVKNAILNGLYSNVTQLEKRLQASCGGEGCDCNIKKFRDDLKNLQDTFKKYDEIATKIDSLQKDIAEKSKAPGKAPSGGGPEIAELNEKIEAEKKKLEKENESLNEQIKELKSALNASKMKIDEYIQKLTASVRKCEEEIKQYKKDEKQRHKKQYNEDLKDADISIPSHLSNPLATEQAKLKSHEASLESLKNLEKLIAFHESVEKNQDGECLSILNNLCTGLEKFLGYQETSKGYSGDGIVYSDLDRLCDGVMSFLHGVLSGVQDDENVTTYNEYIDSPKINNVIDSLNTSVGKGRQAFEKALTQVDTLIKNVTTPINDLLTGVDEKNFKKIPQLIKDIQQMKKSNYEDVSGTGGLTDKTQEALKALNNVDKQLNNNLHPHVKLMHNAVDTFYVNAILGVNDLNAVCSNVSEQLTNLQANLMAKADEEGDGCVRLLTNEFETQIRTPLNTAKINLNNLNHKLNDWIDKAMLVVSKALSKCDEILGHVKNKEQSKTWTTVETAAKNLRDMANELREVAKQVKAQITSWVGTALSEVVTLDRAVRTVLKETKDNIKAAMQKYVKTQLLGDIKGKVEKITGTKGGNGLKNIVEKVKQYVEENYIDDHFATETLEGWIEDILSKSELAKTFLDYYTTNHQELVISTISSYINTEIVKTIPHHPKVVPGKVKETLASIQALLTELSVQVALKAGKNQYYTIAGTIHQALQDIAPGTFTAAKGNLEQALRQILPAVAATSNHIAGQIGDLINDCQIGNVDAALTVATGLESDISTALLKGSDVIKPDHMFQLSDSVDARILGILEAEVGEDDKKGGGAMVTKVKDTNMGLYGKLIKQDKVKTGALTGANKGESEGQLPEAIGNIGREVNSAARLGKIVETNTNGKKDGNFYDDTFTLLCGEVDSALEKLCTAVKDLVEKDNGTSGVIGDQVDPKRGVQKLLEDLKTMLNDDKKARKYGLTKHLREIHEEIRTKIIGTSGDYSGIPETLLQIKTAAEKFHNETIPNTVNACITAINEKVQSEVTEKIRNLKNTALHKFAATKQKELEDLKKLVTDQSARIEDLISLDSMIGLKGLLREMKAWLEDRSLIHIQSPVEFTGTASQLKQFLDAILRYVQHQVMTPKGHSTPAPNANSKKVADIQAALNKLLSHLQENSSRAFTYDSKFRQLLQSLTALLCDFDAERFANPYHPVLLDALRKGMNALIGELDKAYINKYDGVKDIAWSKTKGPNFDPTADANRCAKVFMSCLPMWLEDLTRVMHKCSAEGSWREKAIYLREDDGKGNYLGDFLRECGYKVPTCKKSKQDGELQCRHSMRGEHIHKKLAESLINTLNNVHLNACVKEKHHEGQTAKSLFDLFDLLKCLTTHVGEYYESCHLELPKSQKYPCSVRDICVWLSGLPHTAVYDKIDGHCDKLLNQKDEATNTFPNKEDTVMQRSLQHLNGNIKHICKLAPKILVSIQGHGSGASHAAYPYACCFENNHGQFYYPGDPSSLLDILKDMCMRLLRAFSFLYQQCKHTASDGNGWRECQYGYRVGTYQWDCNEPSDNSSTQPKSQAKCQPNSEANDQPNCLPRSPLQAHLMDGLPGFMPHKFTAVGCQPTCSTCPKGSLVGQCITPMGFADLATAGSIVGRGDDLVDVLATLCKNGGSVLCELVHALQCISPSPPKGLAEMFSYYCNIFQKSYGSLYGHEDTYQTKINDTINKSFPLWPELHGKYDASKLTGALRKLYYSKDGHHQPHIKNGITPGHKDLYSLVAQDSCALTEIANCAPYLKALCHDACHTYPAKHANLYMAWLCRLAWAFWDLLDQLLKAFNNISCQSYGCQCKCGFGKHGVTEEDTSQPSKAPKPSCHCNSIVQCKGPMSVFYQYGFTFGMPKELMGSERKMSCDNFVKQLTRVLHKGYFKELFDEIDDFIWAIRTPFSYLLLALWSLSLLYLLHITVVRLDALRIRSHLRSPASHRIAAQSLLAAARVKALANVKYFSP